MSDVIKLPTMADLTESTEQDFKDNALAVLLNQAPPEKWLKSHPIIQGYRYLPIERVEYLLTRIFTKWWIEVRESSVMANSVAVTVRLYVVNPVTKEIDYQDGVGAAPIQTKKGAGAMDWNQAQSTGVQMAFPMAKTYAVKDAAEQFGKLFGKDVSRDTQISYNDILKKDHKRDPFLDRVELMISKCATHSEVELLRDDILNHMDEIPAEIEQKLTDKHDEIAKL